MTPKERELIQSVATRLQNAKLDNKDAEAEAFINAQVAAQPDAAYKLTQATILQEYTLNQAQHRIQALEKDLEEARSQAPAAQEAGGGSFLGGLFGGGRPQAGAQPRASGRQSAGAGRPGAPGQPGALARPGPMTGQQRGQAGPTGQGGAAGGGMGDFMRSAAAMAVGVAGGHLLFNGLSSMFGEDQEAGAETADAMEAAPTDEAPAGDETLAAEAPQEDAGGWGGDDSGDPALDDLGGDFGGGDVAFGEDAGLGDGSEEGGDWGAGGDEGGDWGGGFDDGDDSFG